MIELIDTEQITLVSDLPFWERNYLNLSYF